MKINNIYKDVPSAVPDEVLEQIISSRNVRIERIISGGHSSPEEFWYDQEENEWVILMKGKAILKFFNEKNSVELNEGDYLNIPSHKKHRVEWTDPETVTIWLAVFY